MEMNPAQLTLSPVNDDLFMTAWRVLTQFNAGQQPAAGDLSLLKEKARSTEKRLRIDDLACAIMRRELKVEVA
jgi:phosphate uptake regulator